MNKRIKYLFQQYIDDKCTETEREEFFSFFNATVESESVNELLDQSWNQLSVDPRFEKERANQILDHILTNHPKPVVKRLTWYRYAVAAAALVLIGTGIYFYQTSSNIEKSATKLARQKINPGSNKAVLTLANGSVINLDETGKGEIAEQAGVAITKTTDGQIVYTVAQSVAQSSKTNNQLNTITTPKGGQYQVNLPDGTKVWLNAASSLKYPPVFTGTERRVELTGEAYFEVAHNKAKPFRVKTNTNGINQEIEVLGTHFNINAYADEAATKTTLLEGSVRVRSSAANSIINNGAVLKPGQQSILGNNTINVADVDIEEVVAWKTGFFQFNEATLPSIMRQLSRWYNIDVVFEGKSSSDLFHFKIPRNLNLEEVLKIFEANGINFKIEGRKLIVKS